PETRQSSRSAVRTQALPAASGRRRSFAGMRAGGIASRLKYATPGPRTSSLGHRAIRKLSGLVQLHAWLALERRQLSANSRSFVLTRALEIGLSASLPHPPAARINR